MACLFSQDPTQVVETVRKILDLKKMEEVAGVVKTETQGMIAEMKNQEEAIERMNKLESKEVPDQVHLKIFHLENTYVRMEVIMEHTLVVRRGMQVIANDPSEVDNHGFQVCFSRSDKCM